MWPIGTTLPLLLHMCILATVLWLHTKEVVSTQVCAQRGKLIEAIERIDRSETAWQGYSIELKSEKFLELIEDKSTNSYFLIKTDSQGSSCILDGELNQIIDASRISSTPKTTNEKIQNQYSKV